MTFKQIMGSLTFAALAMAALNVKIISNLYVIPVLSPTIIFLQGIDLLVCKVSVFFHELDIF